MVAENDEKMGLRVNPLHLVQSTLHEQQFLCSAECWLHPSARLLSLLGAGGALPSSGLVGCRKPL